MTGILFGSRSLLTERDPNEIRRSSEGDPNKYRIKPLWKTMRIQIKDNRNRCEIWDRYAIRYEMWDRKGETVEACFDPTVMVVWDNKITIVCRGDACIARLTLILYNLTGLASNVWCLLSIIWKIGRTFRSFSLGINPLSQTHSVPPLPNVIPR